MELISKWSAIVAGCEEAAAELDYAHAAVAADARAQAFSECIGDLRSACTPRKPQAQWFKRGDGWWLSSVGAGIVECVEWPHVWMSLENGEVIDVDMELVTACVPFSGKQFPIPVGWSVVGG